MARAYEDDLRRKFLAAYDQGSGTLEELAELFGVSLGWGKKISAQRKRSGQAERVRYQAGRKWRAGAEAQKRVVAWVEAQPDLTLTELQAKLNDEAGVVLSRGRVWYLLRKLGLRLKKVAPCRGTRHRSQPSAARGVCRQGSHGRAGAPDLPRRKRRYHFDDATLCAYSRRAAHS